jgi:hypothetical protein
MFDIFYISNKPLGVSAIQVESIREAVAISRTRYLWVLNGDNDYSEFDLTWEPVPWENNQTHVWSSQHQENGDTYLVPKNSVDINYHTEIIPRSTTSNDIVFLDFNNSEANSGFDTVRQYTDNHIRTRFISSYHGTLARIVDKVNSEYAWVTSSVCDYTNFDFTWHPSEWHTEMLHVFPSNDQKFGDTFYIHIPTFKERVNNIELLEWYDTIHFVKDISVPRYKPAEVVYNNDSLVSVIKKHQFTGPYTTFIHENNTHDYVVSTPPLWREKTRDIVSLSNGNANALVPRDAKNFVDKQVYDYPHILKPCNNYTDMLQDIIFISYDEINADANWKIVHDRFPRAKRVHGVEGMDNALKVATEKSDTEWYYAVFAKTQLHNEFSFDFRPDRFQQPKHYIFNARNVLNGLEYGHMGVVLYNCNIISNMGNDFGIDYTLSGEHEVVPELSALATFNASPYQTWRTAFRECSKLAQFIDETPSLDSEYRLEIWKTKAEGDYAEWCLSGANDGVDYFEQHKTNSEELMNAFNWGWLRNYFVTKYGDIN